MNNRLTPAQEIKVSREIEKIADKKRSQSKTVLNLSDVLGMDKTNAEMALSQINENQSIFYEQLTPKLLKKFEKAVKGLQKQYGVKGGISPRSIINRSRKVDLQRASREIYSVHAYRYEKDGTIHFRTNASRKYGASHHIVSVQFLDFQAALNGGNLTNKLALSVLRGAVKFDCDCGRHRFWYRYIATVGGFAYGKPEVAFPKIRNPELTGLGCKHVLRVMHSLNIGEPALIGVMKQFILRYRKDPNQKAKTLTKKQVQQQQINAVVGKEIRQRKEVVKTPPKRLKKRVVNKNKPLDKKLALQQLQSLFNMGVLDDKSFQQMMEKLK